ncbi:MAG: hypothetical protein J0M36_07535 [Caulobacterales bacterium]|nr:hypothetical protein [Caulobacterales bacterium]
MTAFKTATLAAALALAAGAATAQTAYTQPPQTTQSTQQQEAVRAILGALFGDRLGTNNSLDAQWALGRLPLAQQQTQFESRIETEVRARRLSQYEGERARYDYRLLVDLEARYGADRRFTAQERAELSERYAALTQVITQGGYDDGASGWTSLADDRAAFETRVDASVRARRISRTEGTRLKTDYAALIRLESDYRRDGSLNRSEREDLEARLDALDQRVGDVGYGDGGQYPSTPEARLDAIARALPGSGLSASAQAQLRVEHEDLTRLQAAYARLNASADDRAYLDRRLADLETRVRIRR